MRLDAVADRDAQFFEVDWLRDEIISAAAQGRNRVLNEHVACDHDHDRVRLSRFDLAQGIET